MKARKGYKKHLTKTRVALIPLAKPLRHNAKPLQALQQSFFFIATPHEAQHRSAVAPAQLEGHEGSEEARGARHQHGAGTARGRGRGPRRSRRGVGEWWSVHSPLLLP